VTSLEQPSATATHRRVEAFSLADVTLGAASVFSRSRDAMLHLARIYPVDRVLAVFRANAGIDTLGAEPPGSWEGFGHPDEKAWSAQEYPGRDQAPTENLLRGHYAGHFLSMLSLAYAGTGDPLLREKAAALVSGLGEVQAALAATGRYSHPGFLAAYGEWQFSRLEGFAPYGEIWAPYYTCHKIMAGLLDAHELTGNAEALTIATAMGHWVHQRLEPLDRAHVQQMWSLYIAGEYGGMNETMARLSDVADEPLFLETARIFEQDRVLDAGVAGDDILTDMHANQHIPQLIGYVREYEATGERRYLDAAIGVWRMIVPGRTFAHGGTGEAEVWGPPRTVAGDIGAENAECCATYNLVKLARLLYFHTQDPQYPEYIETARLNQILGSRRAVDSDVSPEVMYMFPVHPGAVPQYDNAGTCCGGTGLESHVSLQDSVFFRAADGSPELWVNLFTDAELTWHEQGVRIALETDGPFGTGVRLRIDELQERPSGVALAVRLRIPRWVAGAPAARIAGEEVTLDAEPGGYARLSRVWHSGDVIELELPMALRATPTIDDPAVHALTLGPTVLVARSDATTMHELPLHGLRLPDHGLRTDAGGDAATEAARTGGVTLGGIRFEPAWLGSDAPYHLYLRDSDHHRMH
jgi:DUF1680 family protein